MTIHFYRPSKLKFDEIIVEIAEILDSGMLSNGENCRVLEDNVRRLHKADHVIACSSATAGMKILLAALNTKRIALPSFTWESIGIITRSYERTWMDIDRSTWLPIQKFRNPPGRIDTLILQHTFGNLCTMFPIVEYLKRDVNIVYDAAYSMSKLFLSSQTMAVISMSPTKLATSCEGGVLLLNNTRLAKKIEKIRDRCSRLSEINAVVGLYYLEKLPKTLRRREQIFEYYRKHLRFRSQKIPDSTTYGYYGMLVPNRNEFMKVPKDQSNFRVGEVECRVRYQPLMKGLPNTDYVANRILCIPCYDDVNEKLVVEKLKEVLE